MLNNAQIPLCGFVAYSGTGKTTLLEKLIPLLNSQGIRIGVIKHAHHDFELDHPGKDSYRLRKAGASQTLVASAQRWALITENPAPHLDPDLDALVAQLTQSELDLILVEGFKHVPYPRIELHRPSLGKPLLYPEDESIIAIASDETIEQPMKITQLDLNSPDIIAEFIRQHILLTQEDHQ